MYLAADLTLPSLGDLLGQYLRLRLDPGNVDDPIPHIPTRTKIGIHLSASVTFYAPSERSGPRGMHREFLRCTHSWFRDGPRYDTVLVTANPNVWGMRRFRVAQVIRFLSFSYAHEEHHCALVAWFTTDAQRDGLTGMWLVRPETVNDSRVMTVIPLTSIARACHLMPRLLNTHLPPQFHFSETLEAFRTYYVNAYIDYHSHEVIL